MMAAKSPRQAQIADEFGQPFLDVVLGFASDGYGIQATADIIGYSRSAFRRLCKRRGIDRQFPRGQGSLLAKQAREDRRGKPGSEKALSAARAANTQYLAIRYDGRVDTMAGHCRRIGIPIKTARNRYYRRGDDWGYVFSKISHVRPPSTESHYWRHS